MKPEERFWSHVEKTPTCWLWTGGKTHKGYGRIFVARHKGVRVHRFSWELHFGPIPQGKFVLHKCDNPICVRPDHLFLGTHDDNMADMMKKGRKPKGTELYNAKLTEEVVKMMRESSQSNMYFARLLGIAESAIRKARRREAWTHVK